MNSTPTTKIVMGIDPGLANLGVGVVAQQVTKTTQANNSTEHLASELIRTSSRTPQATRLGVLYEGVYALMQYHKPEALAIEAQFFGAYGDTGFKVGQAFGVCLLAASQLEVPVFEYSPKHVKQALVGTGAASKEQIGYMVRALLGLNRTPSHHVTDALALALTHLSQQRLAKLVM